jgi:hypothetical protein
MQQEQSRAAAGVPNEQFQVLPGNPFLCKGFEHGLSHPSRPVMITIERQPQEVDQ